MHETLLAIGGTIHPCIPTRRSWWEQVKRWLRATRSAPISFVINSTSNRRR